MKKEISQEVAYELLEACKKVLEQYRNKEGNLVHGDCASLYEIGDCNCGLVQLQQTIQKAEGDK